MPPLGLEPTISTGERPQTHAQGSTATGTGFQPLKVSLNKKKSNKTAVGGIVLNCCILYISLRMWRLLLKSYDQDFHKEYIRFVLFISQQYGVRHGHTSQLDILQRTTIVRKTNVIF